MHSIDSIVEGYGPEKLQAAFSRAIVDCGGLGGSPEMVVQTYCDHLRMMAVNEIMAAT
jgi:hypothetical protein